MTGDPLSDFLSFIAQVGAPPANTSAIGPTGERIVRFKIAGEKNGKASGAYQFNISNGRAIGWVRDHRQGVTHIFKPRAQPLSYLEREALAADLEKRRLEKQKQLHNQWIATAQEVRAFHAESPLAGGSHDYLQRKRIGAHGLRQNGMCLLVPMYGVKGRVWNLQRIWPDGKKLYWKGARVSGTFYQLGAREGAARIVLCEGFATGTSIHEATGLPVACAMQANNLPVVAEIMAHRHPLAQIIIAADDDKWSKRPDGTPFNAGVYYGEQAAKLANGRLVLPPFPAHDPLKRTDFNDLYLSGIDLRQLFC